MPPRYLGGDIQHTHLVKGLDMSLLAKVRYPTPNTPSASSSSPHILLFKARDDERAAAARAREQAGSAGAQAAHALALVSVGCEVGRRVKFALEQSALLRQQGAGAAVMQQDMFLPRRTTYVFNMQAGTADEAYSQLPILVTRSKGAAPALHARRCFSSI